MTDRSNQYPSHQGRVDELMAPGNAIEFIQPWHIPVSTTPANTGMSLGGIGSAITVTPAGTTPSIHFLPGRYIESTAETPIRMANFFYREAPCNNLSLRIQDRKTLKLYIRVLPLTKTSGEQWFSDQDPPESIEEKLAEIIDSSDFYSSNREKLGKWDISLSKNTRKLINVYPENYRELNYNLLLDLFPGCITNERNYTTALTGDVEEASIDGIPCYPSDCMHYRGLYPVSETEYSNPSHQCRIKKSHISPIIARDYTSCSLPLLHTEFTVENPTDESIEVSLLQIQENIAGYEIVKSRKNEQDAVFYLQKAIDGQTGELAEFETADNRKFRGVKMHQKPGSRRGDLDGQIQFGVYVDGALSDTDITVGAHDFALNRVTSLYDALFSGRITQRLRPRTYSGKEPTSGGVCVRRILKPGESATISFVMLLDFPTISLGNYASQKRYVHYFPDQDTRLENMILHYFSGKDATLHRIKANPHALTFRRILDNYCHSSSNTLKSLHQVEAMFANGFSFFAEATVWDIDNNFYVRECVDYPFFNSLDVYFYGSFGIQYLLPECDTYNILSFAKAVFLHDDTRRRHSIYYQVDCGEIPNQRYSGIRKQRGAVPHDMGNPIDPSPNAYTWHDVVHWKDLAPKFVLLVYRNYLFTKNIEILTECWPAVEEAIEFLRNQIGLGQCIPLASGTDDTFDNISSHGISVYCASLWIAGLRAAARMADILNISEKAEKYTEAAFAAQRYMRSALWDEELGYYHHFSTPITDDDIDQDFLDRAPMLLRSLGIEFPDTRLSIDLLLEHLNGYIYAGAANTECNANASIGKHRRSTGDADNTYGKSFRERKSYRKSRILELSRGVVKDSFQNKVYLESDDIFADQLVADLYLSLLHLDPITPQQDRVRALNAIYQTNYLINSPAAGAANAVTKDGHSLSDFQAQDVWLGIQFSLAASMLDCEITDRFDSFFIKLHDNIYHTAKIPFGVPEGFNCDGSIGEEDLSYGLRISKHQATLLLEKLQQLGIVSSDGTVERLQLEKKNITKKLRNCLRGVGALDTLGESLHKVLKACSLKFTAGRYFRPGMLYSIISIMDSKAGN